MKKPKRYLAPPFEGEKIIYIAIPKCASTSARSSLKWKEIGIEKVNSSKKPVFTIVRNPYSRLVSIWANRVCTNHGWRNTFSKGREYWKERGIHKGMRFSNFVRAVHRIPDSDAELHFRSISSILNDLDRPIDKIIKLEDLKQEWPAMIENYGLNEIPHLKRSRHKSYLEHYQETGLLDLAYERYEEDFVEFEYERFP